MPAPVHGSLLVVCAANVCRSPYAEFLLGQALPDVIVRSVGVAARAGDPLCRYTRDRIAALPAGPAFTDAHITTRLDGAAIAGADMILTASEKERSAVAVLDPVARSRTFTLVEAAYGAATLQPSGSENHSLAALAARLHTRRGLVTLPPIRHRRWLSLSRSTYGIAIPDAHIGDTRRHEEVYRTISEAVSRFVGAISPASGPREGRR